MRITQSHLDLWRSMQRQPSWAVSIVANRPGVRFALLDSCINAQTPSRPGDVALASLLVLCKSYQRRGELRTELARLVANPGTLIRPEKRSLWARRLLRRLNKKETP